MNYDNFDLNNKDYRAQATPLMRLIPHIDQVEWDVSNITNLEKEKIKNRLVVGITHNEDDFKAILSYLHLKYPDLMDYYIDDGKKFQWKYHVYNNKISAYDAISKNKFDMYGLVYYDILRDMEPIAIGASYLREAGGMRNPKTHKLIENQIINKHTSKIRVGHGYRIFIDPDYRRLGLAKDQWLTEAQLYRDSNIHYQKEQQTFAALKVTQSIFDDPSKCFITSNRDLNLMRNNDTIKCIMDYYDESLIKKFDELKPNLKNFRNKLDWNFLKRENLIFDELIKPWN